MNEPALKGGLVFFPLYLDIKLTSPTPKKVGSVNRITGVSASLSIHSVAAKLQLYF